MRFPRNSRAALIGKSISLCTRTGISETFQGSCVATLYLDVSEAYRQRTLYIFRSVISVNLYFHEEEVGKWDPIKIISGKEICIFKLFFVKQ